MQESLLIHTVHRHSHSGATCVRSADLGAREPECHFYLYKRWINFYSGLELRTVYVEFLPLGIQTVLRMLICTRDLTALHPPLTFIHSFVFPNQRFTEQLLWNRTIVLEERERTGQSTHGDQQGSKCYEEKNHSCLVYFPDRYYNHATYFPDT